MVWWGNTGQSGLGGGTKSNLGGLCPPMPTHRADTAQLEPQLETSQCFNPGFSKPALFELLSL